MLSVTISSFSGADSLLFSTSDMMLEVLNSYNGGKMALILRANQN